MPKLKIILSVCIFAILLSITSIIKTQTRIIEKKVYKLDEKIKILEKDLHETELDYSYLSSPGFLELKIAELDLIEYLQMDFSRIYLSYLDFNNTHKKITILQERNEKKIK